MLTETVNIPHFPFLSPENNTVLGILKKTKNKKITSNYCICSHFTEVTVYLNLFLNCFSSLSSVKHKFN